MSRSSCYANPPNDRLPCVPPTSSPAICGFGETEWARHADPKTTGTDLLGSHSSRAELRTADDIDADDWDTTRLGQLPAEVSGRSR
jgi:hypothetical protein